MIRRASVHLPAAMAMAAVAILHTWPLLAHLGDRLPGLGLGDNVAFAWNLWWGRHALAEHISFFFTPQLMAPLGADLSLNTHTASQAAMAATVLSGLPVIAAQNLILLLALSLNGISLYALALEVGASAGAACAAGMLFVVSPVVTTRLMGHFNLVPLWPFVFACWALVRLVRQPTTTRGVWAGVAVALVGYGDYYLLVFIVLLALTYLASAVIEWRVRTTRRAARWAIVGAAAFWIVAVASFSAAAIIQITGGGALMLGMWRIGMGAPTNAMTFGWLGAIGGFLVAWRVSVDVQRREVAWRPMTAALAAAAVVAAVLMLPLIVSATRVVSQGDYVTQSSSVKSSARGIDPATIVLGPPLNSVVGPRVRRAYERLGIDAMESSGWLGVVTMALMLISLRRRQDPDVRRWAVITAVFFLWALGPFLTLFGANTGLFLPQALARIVPLLDNARIPGRAMLVVAVTGGVLSALALSGRAFRIRGAVVIIAVLGVIESIATPLPLVALPSSSSYATLAGTAGGGAVLPIPFGVRDGLGARGMQDLSAMYFQMFHGRPIAGGFVARVPSRVFRWYIEHEPYHTLMLMGEVHDVGDDDEDDPPPAAQVCSMIKDGLDLASIKYVVVNRELATPAMLDFAERLMPLTRIGRDQQFDLLIVRERC